MELRRRNVITAALVSIVAWGYATAWIPAIRFIPYAFWYGATTTGIVLIYLVFTTTLPVSSSSGGPRPPRRQLAFANPLSWDREKAEHAKRCRYNQSPLAPDAPELSAELDNLLNGIFAKFVGSWYTKISDSSTFTNEVDRTVRTVLLDLFDRLASQDLVNLAVIKLLPTLIHHLHEFDIAERSVKGKRLNRQVTESDELDSAIAARYRGGSLHSAVSLTSSAARNSEQDHLRGLVSRLLERLLPRNIRMSMTVTVLLREIVACAILFPIVNALSDPDTWNRMLENYGRKVMEERQTVRRIRDALDEHALAQSTLGNQGVAMPVLPKLSPHDSERKFERFIRAIRKCVSLSDARRFRNEVASQLRKESSQPEPDLLFLRRLETGKHMLDQRIAQLGMGTVRRHQRLRHRPRTGAKQLIRPGAVPAWTVGPDSVLTSAGVQESTSSLETATLQEMLQHASGLSAFMEFMDRLSMMSLVQFWLVVNGFRNPLEMDGLEINSTPAGRWTAADRADLAQIKETYLGKPELAVPPDLIKTINLFLKEGSDATVTQYQAARQAILAVQSLIYARMERDMFVQFKKSDLWFKLLASEEASSRSRSDHTISALASTPQLNAQLSSLDSHSRDDHLLKPRLNRISIDSWPTPDDDDMAGSIHSVDSDTGRFPSISDQSESAKAVNALQKTLVGIMEEQSERHCSAQDTSSYYDTTLPSLGVSRSPAIDDFKETLFATIVQSQTTDKVGDSEDESADEDVHEAAPGDLGLAEAIDGLTLDIEKLVAQESIITSLLNKAELTNNTAEHRILRKSKASLEREIHRKELQRQQYILQESDNGLYGRSDISIGSVVFGHEPDGKEYAICKCLCCAYFAVLPCQEVHQTLTIGLDIVQVQRAAGEFMPAAVWMVSRRYSEFHALHKRLRARYPAVAQLDFPRRQMVLKLQLQKDLLENRRIGLQKYLRSLLTLADVCRSRDFRTFLSQATIPGVKSNGLIAASDIDVLGDSRVSSESKDVFSRIYNSVSDGVEGFIGHLPVLDHISAAGQNLISAATQRASPTFGNTASGFGSVSVGPPTGTFTAMLDPDTAAEAEAELHAFDSKEPPPLVEPVCHAFLELFELNQEANWLRGRAVVVVLQQLLGGTVERKIRSSFRTAMMPDALAGHIRTVAEMILLPAGTEAAGGGGSPRTDEQRKMSKRNAGLMMSMVLPDIVGSVVGRANAVQAARRVVAAVNNRTLNVHLAFTLVDELMDAIVGHA